MSLDRDALEAERDFLLRSIDDLDAEAAAGDIDAADHAALRDDYVARAAAVMRALETPVAANVSAPPVKSRLTRTVLTITACLALATVAGIFLAQSSGSRGVNDTLTGSLPSTVDERLDAALQLASQGKVVESLKALDAILKTNPDNAQVLAYRGWVLYNTGQLPDQAIAYVDRAIAIDPSYPDAHFFRGLMIWKAKNDPKTAVAEFRLFLSNDPPQSMVPAVEEALAEAQAEAANPTASTTSP